MKKLLLLFVMTLAVPSAYAGGTCGCGHYNPSGVEADCIRHMCPGGAHGNDYAYMCGGGGGSSGSSEPIYFSQVFTGRKTLDNFNRMGETCGSNPLCVVMNTGAILIVGMVTDVPYWAVKGPVLLVKGLGKGVVYTGKAIASPFKNRASKKLAKNQSLAYNAAPGCSGSGAYGSPVPTFNAYQQWEECKRAVLKRQKALTKLNPANKANEDWCKTRVPLGFGPNRLAWEQRCNDGGGAVLVADPNATAAAPAAGAGATTAAGAGAPSAGPGAVVAPAATQTSAGLPAELPLTGALGEAAAAAGAQLPDAPATPASVPVGGTPQGGAAQPAGQPAAAAPAGVPLTPFDNPTTNAVASPDAAAASNAAQAFDGNILRAAAENRNTDDPLVQLARLTAMPSTARMRDIPAAAKTESGSYSGAAVSGSGGAVSGAEPPASVLSSKKPAAPARPEPVMMDRTSYYKLRLETVQKALDHLRVVRFNESVNDLISLLAAGKGAPPMRLKIPRDLLTRLERRSEDARMPNPPDTPVNEDLARTVARLAVEERLLKGLIAYGDKGPALSQGPATVGAREGDDGGAFTVALSVEPAVGGVEASAAKADAAAAQAAEASAKKPACAKKTVRSEQWVQIPDFSGKPAQDRKLTVSVEIDLCD